MTCAYDEMYVEGAMIRMGDMLEYASLDCGLDPDSFWKMFLQSGIADRFEIGDVSIVAGKSGPEIARLVLEKVDLQTDFPIPSWREDRSDLYWCGWILAYFQWTKNRPFSEIWDAVSIRTLRKMYPTLHEADISKAVEAILSLMQEPEQTPVRCLRLLRGLTQTELSEKAGMTVTQLQRIEYGERKVENLSLKTAISLAKALNVRVEELA